MRRKIMFKNIYNLQKKKRTKHIYLRWASPIQPAPAEFPQGGDAARVGGRSGVL
jgi:hypothetical protein